MTLDEQFTKAQADVKTLKAKPANDTLLDLYALYKQGTEGDAAGSRPGMFDVVGRAKFDAWAQAEMPAGLVKPDGWLRGHGLWEKFAEWRASEVRRRAEHLRAVDAAVDRDQLLDERALGVGEVEGNLVVPELSRLLRRLNQGLTSPGGAHLLAKPLRLEADELLLHEQQRLGHGDRSHEDVRLGAAVTDHVALGDEGAERPAHQHRPLRQKQYAPSSSLDLVCRFSNP